MNHKERIDAVMNHQPVDRTPFALVDGGAWVAEHEQKSYREIYHLPDGGASLIVKYMDDIDTDLISGVSGVFTAALNAFGCDIDIDTIGSPVNTDACIKDPKTETSNRTILLPHFVVEAIREKGYVTKLTPHQISNYFQKKQMSLGVEPPYCFHSLRHYNASFLHSQGIPDAYIMARGGWASPHVMQRVYRHALQDKVAGMEQKAVGALQFSLQF